LLEQFLFGSGGHAHFEAFDQVVALAIEEEARIADGFRVLLVGTETRDARAEAAFNVVLQTGARMIARQIDIARRHHEALVYERKDAAREAGWKIGAEIECAVFLHFASEVDAGIFFVGRELDVWVGFVVEKTDVEFWLIILDEIVFEREGFPGVGEDDGIEIGDFAGERAGFRIRPAGFEEVGTDTAAEGGGFADVQDRARGVFEEVDTGALGEQRGFFAGFHFAEVSSE
jgi:hypothetical protein